MSQLVSIKRRYIAFQVFFNLLLWIPVFYEAQKRFGLTDPQIFGIQSIYYVVFCLLEMPTGWFADRFGYRRSVLLGSFVLLVANMLPPLLPNYPGFLSHFLAIALARSLISGAASAYLYEAMAQAGDSKGYKKVEGDARFYSLVTRVIAWSGVGWLMEVSTTLPYWLSALSAGCSWGVAMALPIVVPVGEREAASTRPGWVQLRALRLSFAGGGLVALLMLQGVGMFVMVRVLQVNLYQPVLSSKAFAVTSFGWVMSLMTVFEAVGSKLAPKLRTYVSDVGAVTSLTLGLSLCLVIIAVAGQAGTLLAFCLFSLAAGLAFPIQKQVVNDAIPDSRLRATLLSMESIVDRAICAVAVLPLGPMVAAGHLALVLAATALWTAVVALVVHVGCRRRLLAPLSPVPVVAPGEKTGAGLGG